jgi:hypothetical protein
VEAFLLDDEVVVGDAELADDLGEVRSGGAQLAEAIEASVGRVRPASRRTSEKMSSTSFHEPASGRWRGRGRRCG